MTRGTAPRRPLALVDLGPPTSELRADVVRGLTARPRTLPPKYFYDEAGAALFERITTLQAYYLSRVELSILRRHADGIGRAIGPRTRIVEFGSGSGEKTRLLLRHLVEPASYVPVDISRSQLMRFAASIGHEFPHLEVLPVCADYTKEFPAPTGSERSRSTLAFFPGSTIGNFEPDEASVFLRRVRDFCGPGGRMLVGTDLHKERSVLERAYDDPEGVTAAFNLNILRRINRDCGADFDLKKFRHQASYDDDRKRVQLRLVCLRDCTVTLPGEMAGKDPVRFRFRAGDQIITEHCYKFTVEGFTDLAHASGWNVARFWTDELQWFGVWLLSRTGGRGRG